MEDNEIIKALECCMDTNGVNCGKCPYCDGCVASENTSLMMKDALDLINRQKAEIESIKKTVRKLTYNLRCEMTSVTRYVKHKKENKPRHLKMQYFKQKHIEYQELAEKAVNNILKCLNENQELRNVENLHNDKICENIKAEAVKEFADKVLLYIPNIEGDTTIKCVEEAIKQTLKETVGDAE